MDGLLAVFILLIGSWFAFRREWIESKFLPAFRYFVLYISLPAYVFSSLVNRDISSLFNAKIFVTFALATLILYPIFIRVGRSMGWRLEHAMLLGHGATASNSLLMGVPILALTFGDAITPIVVQIILFENIILLPAFMVITNISMSGDWGSRAFFRSLVRNQFLWAVIAAVPISVLNINLHAGFENMAELLGQAAAPVAIVTIGGILASTGFVWPSAPAYAASLGKLVALPLIALVIGHFLSLTEQELVITVLFMAMPNAAIFPLFGEEVKFAKLSNSIFIISYSFAFFSLAGWMWWLGSS